MNRTKIPSPRTSEAGSQVGGRRQILGRIGVQVTQKAVGKTLSRWLPIVGPIVIGSYSLIDTRNVGKTAIDTFNREIEIEPAELDDSQVTRISNRTDLSTQ